MKIFVTTLFLTFLGLIAAGQSKKDIKANNIKSITVWQSDKIDNSTQTVKETYEEFDKHGNTTLKIKFSKTGSISSKETCRYDKNQNKIEDIKYDENGKITSHKVYVFNYLGRKTEEREFSSDGDIILETIFMYNLAGDKSSEVVTDAKGNLLKKTEYKYNSKNLKIQKVTIDKISKTDSIKKWAYEFY